MNTILRVLRDKFQENKKHCIFQREMHLKETVITKVKI